MTLRGLTVFSPSLGLSGKCDVVEFVQCYLSAPVGLPVVKGAFGDGAAKHFLQAQSLGTELEGVFISCLWGLSGSGHGGLPMRHLLNTLFITSEDIYLSLDGENVVANREGQAVARYPLHMLFISCLWGASLIFHGVGTPQPFFAAERNAEGIAGLCANRSGI